MAKRSKSALLKAKDPSRSKAIAAIRKKLTKKRKPKENRQPPSLSATDASAKVMVCLPSGEEFEIRTHDENDPASSSNFVTSSKQWTYVVRSRQRWATTEETTETQNEAAYKHVTEQFGLSEEAVRQIAQAHMVEVSIPWRGEGKANSEQGWAECIFPWEYLLAGATHRFRRTQSLPLTVVRHLRVPGSAAIKTATLSRVMFVVSEPGALQGEYNFESERDLIQTYLKDSRSGSKWRQIDSPSADELRREISSFRPDIVHISAFDTHLVQFLFPQGRKPPSSNNVWEKQAQKAVEEEKLSDGLVLAGDTGLHPANADELATILAGDHNPSLIAMNFGNSAARIAPRLLAAGVQCAVGLQDTFDDDLAEIFFSLLYSHLKNTKGDYGTAFREAWEHIREETGLRKGSGIVLWSRESIVTNPKTRQALPPAGVAPASRERKADKPIPANSPNADHIAEQVKVSVDALADINYSVLHNKRPVFKLFSINSKYPLKDVTVRVSLHVGTEAATFKRTLNTRPPSENLTEDIHLPLTSALARTVQESINSSVYVTVKWGEYVLYGNSHRVRLTPVDQWRDNDTDGRWLPSFIFPRDPAVSRIVDTAQRYVRVLRDDPVAGFDGYQSLDTDSEEEYTDIDLQVQAIWSAIVHEMRLGYINPPPSYTSELDSQRLRTPSAIEQYHSGTCIDLALFFAACLESVEIYPVIFLLNDHAFPGYWRSNEYQEEFRKVAPQDVSVSPQGNVVRAAGGGDVSQRDPWISRKTNFREIVDYVNAGKLVPIESVALTENSGFWEAVKAGRKNLSSKRRFHSMLDIVIAREVPVTPLPILWERS